MVLIKFIAFLVQKLLDNLKIAKFTYNFNGPNFVIQCKRFNL